MSSRRVNQEYGFGTRVIVQIVTVQLKVDGLNTQVPVSRNTFKIFREGCSCGGTHLRRVICGPKCSVTVETSSFFLYGGVTGSVPRVEPLPSLEDEGPDPRKYVICLLC